MGIEFIRSAHSSPAAGNFARSSGEQRRETYLETEASDPRSPTIIHYPATNIHRFFTRNDGEMV
jgi:hypothetical protein